MVSMEGKIHPWLEKFIDCGGWIFFIPFMLIFYISDEVFRNEVKELIRIKWNHRKRERELGL